jgi:hypothetical protein
MALRWWRRQRIDPMPRHEFQMAVARGAGAPVAPLSDDYLIEGDEEPNRPSVLLQIAHFLRILLIVVMAILSLAVFWLIAVMLNII